ncbi:MAG TPA: PHP domain-containing protein [Gaiellales bacterium]|nr:PHP domain-containing protein [Gaiellales bacterium]
MREPHSPGMETPLLCELHAHSSWSDGELELGQVVDLYGRRGFDVLCITDHTVPGGEMITARNHLAYLEAIREQAARAAVRYGMLVIPGLELTWDGSEATDGAHAVAVGLEEFVSVANGIDAAIDAASEAGAAIIAAHPHGPRSDPQPGRTTRRFWADEALRARVHRFELLNRNQAFEWVAAAGLPAVASGDFHRPEHADTWKTLIPCAPTVAAVVEYLRSGEPAALTRPGAAAAKPAAVARAV